MLSVSMLSGYLYCQRKVYLQYVLKIFEPPKPALVLGSLRHKVFEEINNAEESIVKEITKKISFDEIRSMYEKKCMCIVESVIKKSKKDLEQFDVSPQDAFENMKSSVLEEAKQRAKNVFDFIEKNNVFGEELWEKLTPKILCEFCVESERLGLKGIVDKLEIYNDYMVPIELKTGKCPPDGAWPSHKIQLCAYIAMLNEKQRKVKEGKLIYLDAGKIVNQVNNPFVEEEIIELIQKTKALLNSRKVPDFESNDKKCDVCGIKEQCHNAEFIQNRVIGVFKQG